MENLKDSLYEINCVECKELIIRKRKCHISAIIRRGSKCDKCFYKRNCSICGKIIKYNNPSGFHRAKTKNSLCAGCVKIGNNWTWNKGKKLPPEIREKVVSAGIKNLENYNKLPRPESHRKRLSEVNKGKKLSTEHRKKIRLGVLKRRANNLKLYPNYTKEACIIFEEINKELGWRGQHAENGDEFNIKELGYWVDYYEPNLNIVIEYDDKSHKNKEYKDSLRQKEIEQYLGCKFYRIKEGQDWREVINPTTLNIEGRLYE